MRWRRPWRMRSMVSFDKREERLKVRHPLPSVLLAAASLPFHQVLCVFALGSACNSVIEDRFSHLLLRLRQFKLWAAGLIAGIVFPVC
ncbi:UNVERIFIED_CONTAM: hypothetical protein Slati_1487100 [Sesamum latifolium]|uniref:Uncharacterized protein n=1 Tax=Sesamum latifolium TaxID=2727402 RepID=A0AAW2X547_9LAMI